MQQPDTAPRVLVLGNERVGCIADAVWFAAALHPDHQMRIRRYTMAGALQRNLLVEMPERKVGESGYVDEASFVEQAGQLEFDVIVLDLQAKQTREKFSVKL